MTGSGPIGILGGTFDPIHYGHLRLAQDVAEGTRLTEVRVMPAGVPPHRAQPHASPQQRLEMVRLAVADNPLFVVDDREVMRAATSYSVETLAAMRREVGPQRPLCMLLGADAFLDLATWHRWHDVFTLAHVVVAHRPGFPLESWRARMPQPLAREYEARELKQPLGVHLTPCGGITSCPTVALDISSSFIRTCLGRKASARYLLPDPVLDYISRNNLYAEQNEAR